MTFNRLLMLSGVAVVMMVGAGGVVKAADTDTLDIEAVIVAPVSITCAGDSLNFGNTAASGVAGTVQVTTSGSINPAGGVTHFGGQTAGECAVTGFTGAAYDITFSAASINVTDPVSNDTMAVGSFTVSDDGAAAQTGPYVGDLNAGADALTIGGTLTVGINQTAGSYAGSVDLTVVYQ